MLGLDLYAYMCEHRSQQPGCDSSSSLLPFLFPSSLLSSYGFLRIPTDFYVLSFVRIAKTAPCIYPGADVLHNTMV